MYKWTALSDTLPQDQVVLDTQPGIDFNIQWVSSEFMFNQLNPVGVHKPAGTVSLTEDPAYQCRITATTVFFAYDPRSQGGVYLYYGALSGPGNCAPNCGADGLDFMSIAVHEFGHAFGMAHTLNTGSSMYNPQAPNDSTARTLSACDIALVKAIYRDNFGPAAIDSFVVQGGAGGSATCTWRVREESECRRYSLVKQLEDGTTMTVADSVPCLGAGVTHAVVDSDPGTGSVLYVLSVHDAVASNVWQQTAIAEQYFEATTPSPLAARAASFADNDETPSQDPGFETPEDAVRALGISVTNRDDAQYQRVKADGFMYFSVNNNGLFWGRTIDNILEDRLRECLAAQDSTIDSLAFDPQGVQPLADNLVQVTANAQYLHRCQSNEAEWAGQILAIVERRRVEDGWRIRRVTELW